MPIQFQCASCGKQLRVPDTAAGKKAKCPDCQQVVTVPMQSTEEAPPTPVGPPVGSAPVGPPPAGLPPVRDPMGAPPAPPQMSNPYAGATNAPGQGLANPYAAPTTAALGPTTAQMGTGSGRIEATRAVSVAWMLFKEHMGVLIGCFVVLMAANYGVSIVQQVIQMLLLQLAGFGFGQVAAPQGQDMTMLFTIIYGVAFVFYFLSQAVQAFLWAGLLNLQLHISRGQQVNFGMLFSGGRWFTKVFLGNILFGLMILLGLLALIVPGIYLSLRYWSFSHFIVDRDCGILESFKLAGAASKDNMGETFLLGLIGIGLLLLGVIGLCIGLLFTAPLVYLSMTIAYLMMTGQPFREQPRGF